MRRSVARFGKSAPVRYAILSYGSRRDLEVPMRLFKKLQIIHFCRKRLSDVAEDDYQPSTVSYTHPLNLYRHLRSMKPDVVQSVEPFALVTLPYSLVVLLYVMLTATPVVLVSLENVPVCVKYGRGVGWLLRRLLLPLVSRATLIFYLNEGAKDNFIEAGADPRRLVRQMYGCWGVDLEEFSPEPEGELGRAQVERVILFVGRLEPAKGVFDLLEAYRLLRESARERIKLVFVGEGRSFAEIVNWAKQHELQAEIEIVGAVKNRDLPAAMRSADVLAAPSVANRLWAEQVGMVLLQALACGLPVVATRSGSIPEFIDDGATGLLVPERSPCELSEALRRVLFDDELRRHLAVNGRAAAVERYDALKNIRLIEDDVLTACTA